MKTFGLIGHPLTHSFSKQYFDAKIADEKLNDVVFKLFDIEYIADIKSILQDKTICGLAATIPYKQAIIPYLNQVDEVVKKINACNCIKINNGELIGFNTDVPGFKKSFEKKLLPHHTKALILGDGGAAAAVKFVLRELQICYISVTRKKVEGTLPYNEVNANIIHQHNIIINTTPLGTFPEINDCPDIPYQYLTPQHYLFDLVYNPSTTLFMQKGLEQGTVVQNGYEMLQLQAEENWKIWNA